MRRVAREGYCARVPPFGEHPAREMDRPRRHPGAHLVPSLPTRARDDESRARRGLGNPSKLGFWGTIAEDCTVPAPVQYCTWTGMIRNFLPVFFVF